MISTDSRDSFLEAIEERLKDYNGNKIQFSSFLEKQMDRFDYSNTSLAKKVFHRVERKGDVQYLPVTRQTIGAWLKGSMPSSREIYVTLGMAFEMKLDEINYVAVPSASVTSPVIVLYCERACLLGMERATGFAVMVFDSVVFRGRPKVETPLDFVRKITEITHSRSSLSRHPSVSCRRTLSQSRKCHGAGIIL